MTRRSLLRAGALTASVALGAAALSAGLSAGLSAEPAGAAVLTPTRSTLVVTMHGNGHGHGLSQYGAQGAALAGLSASRIVAFYYPGTVVRRLARHWIRVRVSGAGHTVTVAPSPHLYVTGMHHYLATGGVRRYRLVANSGHGIALQRLGTARGAAWHTVYANLADGARFHRVGDAPVRLYHPDGSSVAYRGFVRAVRARGTGAAAGVYAVNLATLDEYTAGVVPREMPISWRRAAVEAQALAVRSYGRYATTHPRSTRYDICDTTMCQVYGGEARYTAKGRRVWTDAPWAAAATSDRTITYAGKTIFAQFSASNGGWTADGGKPYLVARRDPYDDARSGDPYLSYRRSVSTSALARYYGLATLTGIEVTGRTAGGRITTAYVSGLTGARHHARIRTDGSTLSWAVGAGTTWLTFANP